MDIKTDHLVGLPDGLGESAPPNSQTMMLMPQNMVVPKPENCLQPPEMGAGELGRDMRQWLYLIHLQGPDSGKAVLDPADSQT